MNPSEISIQNDTDLHHRIMKLNNLKEEQEIAIKRNVKELVYSMHPSMLIKNALNKFTGQIESKNDLKSIGINLAKDFLITKLFGKSGSLKGFLSSLLVKKATDYVINNHSDVISNGVEKVQNYFKEFKTKATA